MSINVSTTLSDNTIGGGYTEQTISQLFSSREEMSTADVVNHFYRIGNMVGFTREQLEDAIFTEADHIGDMEKDEEAPVKSESQFGSLGSGVTVVGNFDTSKTDLKESLLALREALVGLINFREKNA